MKGWKEAGFIAPGFGFGEMAQESLRTSAMGLLVHSCGWKEVLGELVKALAGHMIRVQGCVVRAQDYGSSEV